MKKSLLLAFMLIGFISSSFAGTNEKALKVAKANLTWIKQLATDPILLADVKSQNDLNLSTSQAQKLQTEWQKIGISESVKPYLNKPSAAAMRKTMAQKPILIKCFLLDRQGNIVATAPKSRDFIHGTEDKFLKCYNGGDGKVWIGPAMLDVSTKIYSIQVAVPVQDGGKAIGVLVATLSLE